MAVAQMTKLLLDEDVVACRSTTSAVTIIGLGNVRLVPSELLGFEQTAETA